jgi:hypothetical protein
MNRPLKILFKFPSRGRPQRFFDSLDSIYTHMFDRENFWVSVTLDDDDTMMSRPRVIERIHSYDNISIAWGKSESKVHAINRDMPDYDWDILCVHSDDMKFTFHGFDQVIRQAFEDSLDWLIHIPDNDAKDALATYYIAGRPFYERRGHIYNPAYKSLFCDNEVQAIARIEKRYKFVNFPGMIWHGNAAYGHMEKDEMFIRQQEIGWTIDQQTYIEREAKNFYL